MSSRGTRILTAFALVGLSACSSSPTAPTPPTPPLTISCPVVQTAQSLDGSPVLVTFPNPTVSGGEGISSVSCTPASGSRLPVGISNVTCSVEDTRRQTATCSFQVNVVRVPRLSASRFTAFGDSITEGLLTSCPVGTISGLDGLLNLELDTEALRSLRPPQFSNTAYPVRLQGMLAARYAAQSITVINQGSGGETVATGVTELPRVLAGDMPQALLLMEGVNDINQKHSAGIPIVVGGLRTMVQEARRRGITVFLGTLLPQRRGACRAYDYSDGVDDIAPANAQIRSMASSEAVPIVDLYQGFSGATDVLLGPDGLHPNDAGYQKIAELFYAAIAQRLEQ